ncbi:hypothetical protein [Corallococcus sicarius]|nr:hypothetical protein [Corallococcus sicarius]
MPRSRSFLFVLLALGGVGAGCYPTPNHMPVILKGPRPLGSPSTPGGLKFEEGTVLQLQLEVKDQENDEVFFKWSQVPAEPAGAFSSTSVATPTWTVPSPPENPDTPIYLYVEVEDRNGGVLIGQSPALFVIKK